MTDTRVKILTLLAHPRNPRVLLSKGSACSKSALLTDLGAVNYAYALKEGWIEELPEDSQSLENRPAVTSVP